MMIRTRDTDGGPLLMIRDKNGSRRLVLQVQKMMWYEILEVEPQNNCSFTITDVPFFDSSPKFVMRLKAVHSRLLT